MSDVLVSYYTARGRGGKYVIEARDVTFELAAQMVHEFRRDTERVHWAYCTESAQATPAPPETSEGARSRCEA